MRRLPAVAALLLLALLALLQRCSGAAHPAGGSASAAADSHATLHAARAGSAPWRRRLSDAAGSSWPARRISRTRNSTDPSLIEPLIAELGEGEGEAERPRGNASTGIGDPSAQMVRRGPAGPAAAAAASRTPQPCAPTAPRAQPHPAPLAHTCRCTRAGQ
jgi:hypothetical protein